MRLKYGSLANESASFISLCKYNVIFIYVENSDPVKCGTNLKPWITHGCRIDDDRGLTALKDFRSDPNADWSNPGAWLLKYVYSLSLSSIGTYMAWFEFQKRLTYIFNMIVSPILVVYCDFGEVFI